MLSVQLFGWGGHASLEKKVADEPAFSTLECSKAPQTLVTYMLYQLGFEYGALLLAQRTLLMFLHVLCLRYAASLEVDVRSLENKGHSALKEHGLAMPRPQLCIPAA